MSLSNSFAASFPVKVTLEISFIVTCYKDRERYVLALVAVSDLVLAVSAIGTIKERVLGVLSFLVIT